jgi:hypothetical protein
MAVQMMGPAQTDSVGFGGMVCFMLLEHLVNRISNQVRHQFSNSLLHFFND